MVDAQKMSTPEIGLYFPLHEVSVEIKTKAYLVMDVPEIEMVDTLLSDFSGAFNVMPYNSTLAVEWKQGARPLWAVAHRRKGRRADVQVHVMKYTAMNTT